jgi:hypothetical protein
MVLVEKVTKISQDDWRKVKIAADALGPDSELGPTLLLDNIRRMGFKVSELSKSMGTANFVYTDELFKIIACGVAGSRESSADQIVAAIETRQARITPDAYQEIQRVLKEYLTPFGHTEFHVKAGLDHDGDPVLFIDADYKLSKTPVDPAIVHEADRTLRRCLIEAGDDRFPHVRHHFHKAQKVVGFR